jgi:hypothetical protein
LDKLKSIPLSHKSLRSLRKEKTNFILSLGYQHQQLLLNKESKELIIEYTNKNKQLLKINQELPNCLWVIQPKHRKVLTEKSMFLYFFNKSL